MVNQVTNPVLPLIQNNLNLITALTARLDLVEVDVAGKQDQLTASYPLSISGSLPRKFKEAHLGFVGTEPVKSLVRGLGETE